MPSRRVRIAVLTALLVALCGCSAKPPGTVSSASPDTDGASLAAETPSTTPAPDPTHSPEPVAVPNCAELLSLEQVRVTLNDDRVEGPDPLDAIEAPSVLGPAARHTFETATDAVGCSYGIPYSDGGFYVIVLAVDAASASELVSALEASNEYEHTTRGDIAMFSKGVPEGIGTYLGYALDENVWAIVQGTMVSSTTSVNIAADAVTAVLG
ncbi:MULTISPECIES: hypothetical protein [Microbacterium]|uniref:hypothetical protein n=1 Tax=Microbacterium aurum TaxID=36805 RepID=UPI0012F4E0E0|nr:hypothetical protein [Microbacterium aurum]MBM7827078.1 hypothetical protein [Microbacterium aurum]